MRSRQSICPVSRTIASRDTPFIEVLYRGFVRCMEAERHLDVCVSDHDLELAQQQLSRAKLELQQALDDYVDARIQQWFAPPHAGGV
jgi:hypothetical protein